jgi:serine/threonine protein kinase/DNA-binding beta-propeller fold protein YncE
VSDEFPSAFSEFAIGSQIAGYRLEEQIGRGGMAVVYRAHDVRLDRNVALKILAPGLAADDAFRKRFIRESRAAAAVDHPNIIPVYDAGEADGVLFIAMRFVHGRDVRTLLDATGPLPAGRATDIIGQVAAALDAAHARGLVHRDVKPANMLLDATAGGGRQDHVYLSDFGLSKQSHLSQTGLTSAGQFLGTLDYVAPEQVEGHPVDGRADLYALACAAFELLSGAPPFKRDAGLAVVWAKLSEPPPSLSSRRADLPAAVDGVMSRGMAKVPADRYATCGEFAAALREACGLGPVVPLPPALPVRDPTEIALPPIRSGGPWDEAAPLGGAAAASASAPPASAGPSIQASGPQPGSPPAAAGPSAAGPSAAGPSAAGPSAAGPPTETGHVPAAKPTKPGLTEPSPPAPAEPAWGPSWPSSRSEPEYRLPSYYPAQSDYRASQPSSPSPPRVQAASTVVHPPLSRPWWRGRAAMSIAAAAVVIGVVVAAFTTLHHGGGSGGNGSGGSNRSGGGLATAIQPPGCSTAAASAQSLTQVRGQTVSLGGNPFGVVVTPDGKYSFVSLGNAVAVLNNAGSLAPAHVTTVPAPGAKKDEAITSNGTYLLAATGSGAYVISTARAEAGDGSGAVLGKLAGPPGNPSNEVAFSPDNKFVFITFQNQGDVAVFDLAEAIAGGFGQAGLKGLIQLGSGSDPQAMAVSPDGQWLYVTGESQTGRLFVVDLQKAETNPAHAVHSSAAAGCAPARVITDGTNVWVTDRDSNALVVFSAAKLLSNPAQSLIARVSTGQTPIGLSFVNGGNEIMVADANTRGVQGADNLALFSTQLALQGKKGALKGFISTGQVPRELALEPGGKTLLWTDNGSGQLQAIDTGSLP